MPVSASTKMDRFARAAEDVAAAERAIQLEIDRREKTRPKAVEKSKRAMQAGARTYPEPPLPQQHQPKPGAESELELTPMYDAPHYKGSEKLKGKVALITGADSGIGRAVAVLFAREGADVAIAYLNEHDDAEETKAAIENEGRRCITISGDVADPDFCKDAVDRTAKQLGRLDVLVNNAAFQEHVNDFEDLRPTSTARSRRTFTGISTWPRPPCRK
jgi:hypothetical protein